MKKQDIRIIAKKIRANLDSQIKYNKDLKIIKQIKNNINYKEAKIIGIFNPFNSEINIELLKDNNKSFAYPKMVDKRIVFILTDNKTKWEINKFGINEPIKGKIVSDNIDLLIVPALAVNKNNYRIGYGMGHYDAYIAEHKPKYTIGIIYEELKIEFNEDPWDIALNEIISS